MGIIEYGFRSIVFCLIGSFFVFCAIKDYKKGAYAACGIDTMIVWWIMCAMLKLNLM